MIPLHAQLRRRAIHAFLLRDIDGSRPKFVRYRGLPLAVPPPFFKARLSFFEADGRSFASRHGLPSRRNPAEERPYQLCQAEFTQACRKLTMLSRRCCYREVRLAAVKTT